MRDIDDRLKTAAGFVRKGVTVADIGTDHAYLPAYIVMNNIAAKAIACDLRRGPLRNAEATVHELNLSDRIEIRHSDGLNNISPGEADDIIICGMGGNLITDILSRALWIKDSRYRLILQPQSHAYDLREFLFTNGFSIINETGVRSEGRVYTVIVSQFGPDSDCVFDDIDIYFGKLIYENNDISKDICRRTLGYLKVRYKSELDFGSAELAERFRQLINKAEEIMDES